MCHQFETFIGGTCSSSSSSRKAREMTNVVCAMFNAFSLFPSKMILWCEVHVQHMFLMHAWSQQHFSTLLEKHLLSLNCINCCKRCKLHSIWRIGLPFAGEWTSTLNLALQSQGFNQDLSSYEKSHTIFITKNLVWKLTFMMYIIHSKEQIHVFKN